MISRRDEELLRDVLEAIERICAYLKGVDEEAFNASSMIQDAVVRNLEIIGEAANALSPEFLARQSGIPWRDMIGMRNRLIHGYRHVNPRTVWVTAVRDVPALAGEINNLLGTQ